MLNTINATSPMLTNSTTRATKSYSSQCRSAEGMMFIPVSNGMDATLSVGAIQRWSAPIARFAALNLSTIISSANLSSAWPSVGSCKVIWR
jgi:hypothetical protein